MSQKGHEAVQFRPWHFVTINHSSFTLGMGLFTNDYKCKEITMSKKANIQADIDKFLDDFLSSDRKEVYTTSRREDFSHQWREYEEENLCNFF